MQGYNLNAQTYVGPVLTDLGWYSAMGPASTSYISGINTAVIDYVGGPNGQDFGTLAVSDYYGNGCNGGVAFLDVTSGFKAQFDYTAFPGRYVEGMPDIVVGNSRTNPGLEYIVAAAYPTTAGPAQIDYYDVLFTGPGSGTFAVTPLGSTVFTGVTAGTVHIDIIAQAGNTVPTGLPFCDNFVITFDDGGSGSIYVYEGSLNIRPAAVPPALLTAVASGAQPDVAGIQRTIGSSVHDLALVAYTDNTEHNLYYVEYDLSASSFVSSTPVELIDKITLPRIDAIDDYTINTPTLTNAIYTIVAEKNQYSSCFWDNTQFLPGPGIDDGSFLPSSYVSSPSVAFGGNGNTQYQVVHYTNEYLFLGNPDVYMEPLNWIRPTAVPDYYGSFQDYYQVNTNPIIWPNFVNGVAVDAISTPCNHTDAMTLVTWGYYDYSTNVTDVFYKATNYGAPRGYNYRTAPTKTANIIPKEWGVYPNPATTEVNIDVPENSGNRYELTDMAGKTIQTGTLQTGQQAINIKGLVPGNYNVSMYKDEDQVYHTLVTKQ
jgi:hypothetical protein